MSQSESRVVTSTTSTSYERTTTTHTSTGTSSATEMTKQFKRKYAEYEDIDIEELLNRLTEDEIATLNQAIDPDVRLL